MPEHREYKHENDRLHRPPDRPYPDRPPGVRVVERLPHGDHHRDKHSDARQHEHDRPQLGDDAQHPDQPGCAGEPDYPLHDTTVTVTQCGRVCFGRQKFHLSTVFAGQNIGIKQVADKIWLVSFMQYELGFFDDETCRLGPTENPFGAKVLPMSPV